MSGGESEFLFPDGQNYDCLMCAKGCLQAWDVDVDAEAAARIRTGRVDLRVLNETGQSGLVEGSEGYVTRKKDGRCIYLREDRLCALHAEEGYEVKPKSCQEFPFTFVETPDGIAVGVSFFCTAIQRNHGRPLQAQRSELERLYRRLGNRRQTLEQGTLYWAEGRALEWAEYRRFESWLLAELGRRPPEEGLEAGLAMALARVAEPSQTILAEGTSALDSTTVALRAVSEESRYFAYCLLGVIEAERPGLSTELAGRLLSGEEVYLHEADWTGSLDRLGPYLKLTKGEQFDKWMRPFLTMVVHRKSLLLNRPLLPSLVHLTLTVRLLRFYCALACLKRSGDGLLHEDFTAALDRIERDYMAHARGFEPLLGFYAEFYLSVVR